MHSVPPAVLAHWSAFAGRASRPFGTGLINDTFLVEATPARALVQRLHPVFSPRVHDDIAAVTAHLAAKGLVTPTLIPTDAGARWCEVARDDGSPGVWRAITFIEHTHTWDRVPSPRAAYEAGALVGRAHVALDDLDHTYVGRTGRPHDTARHLDTLRTALDEHRAHRLYDRVAPVAAAVLDAASRLAGFDDLAPRHAHGDLKISNLLFDADDCGVCLVDLDTVGRMVWPHEMGDALRSWCNPAGEDAAELSIDEGLFTAAIEGYGAAARGLVTDAERERLVDGLATICVELSARFLADALRERYFGWNASKYATRGDHNLVRGTGQWRLAQSVMARAEALRSIVATRLG